MVPIVVVIVVVDDDVVVVVVVVIFEHVFKSLVDLSSCFLIDNWYNQSVVDVFKIIHSKTHCNSF